jgi:hypothetical protein
MLWSQAGRSWLFGSRFSPAVARHHGAAGHDRNGGASARRIRKSRWWKTGRPRRFQNKAAISTD